LQNNDYRNNFIIFFQKTNIVLSHFFAKNEAKWLSLSTLCQPLPACEALGNAGRSQCQSGFLFSLLTGYSRFVFFSTPIRP
jgi:hypothetical protein